MKVLNNIIIIKRRKSKMQVKLTKLFRNVSLILILTGAVYTQVNHQSLYPENVPGVNPPFISGISDVQPDFISRSFLKRPGRYTPRDWQQLIDSLWGPGLPTATKLQIFDKYWNTIDSAFACFNNLSINWDSLKQVYRPQIAAGVSRGRFCAILTHLSLMLQESHSNAYDMSVVQYPLFHGTPLFLITGLGNTGFGAGVTPLPDSSLLVYNVVNNHPLGLQRGDRILGYDGIPWKVLYKQLIEWELPIAQTNSVGSSPSSFTHSLLRSGQRNWHLFDTIDIVKYNSGDTVHFPTTSMIGVNLPIHNTEQMDVGVPKPVNPQVVSYGTYPNTNIGYIYVWGWYNNAQQEFLSAVFALLGTDGLIIDFRYNLGGNMFMSNDGLSLLFDTAVSTIDFGKRCSPNHQQMCSLNNPGAYVIPGGPPGYNKPIAVLTGPGCVSSGDQVALRFKYHKHARFFGKSTAAAFNHPVQDSLYADFVFRYPVYDAYELSNPNVYLTHREFTVDEDVWLTPDKVAQGKDDVVDAAVDWINSVIGVSKLSSEIPQHYSLGQNYPNPFNPATKIKFELTKSGSNRGKSLTRLIIYDVLGREVVTLVNEDLAPGTYEVDWNASGFASGVYYYQLKAGGFSQSKKMILIK